MDMFFVGQNQCACKTTSISVTQMDRAAAWCGAARAAPSFGVARVSMRKCASAASAFPAVVFGGTRAVSSTWSPSPSSSSSAHRRRDAARRLSIRAASSKASKVGRFPSTPASQAHPFFGEHGNTSLSDLCAAWRAESGKPGTTVIREVQELLRGGDTRRHLSASNEKGETCTLFDPDSDTWRLLLSHKNENLYNAFALEVASVSPGSVGLTTGLFALPSALPEPTLARMAGLRAVIDPLACAPTAEALIAQVQQLNVNSGINGGTGVHDEHTTTSPLGTTPVSLYHDCVARHPLRMRSPDLYAAIGETVSTWGGGFKHGMYARFNNPNDPEATAGVRETLRFAIVETAAGYVFGLTTYAPPKYHAKIDWSRKPNNYSAGTQPAIAGIALNAVLNPAVVWDGWSRVGDVFGDDARDAGAIARDAGDISGDNDSAWSSIREHGVVLDPCCGGGTILHAAWSRGLRSVGGDINSLNARNANGNLASFRRSMPVQHQSLATCDSGTPYAVAFGEEDAFDGFEHDDDEDEETENQSSSRPSRLLTPTPTVTVGDVMVTNASAWQENAVATFKDPQVKIAAVVSNLPFGRQVSVGGGGGSGKHGECTIEELVPLLLSLKDIAPRHAFVTGAPVADAMRELGYENVTDVALCRHGRMFLTVAYGKNGAFGSRDLKNVSQNVSKARDRDNVPSPSVAFTVQDAVGARAANGHLNPETPEWVESLIAAGDVDRASGLRKSRREKEPPESIASKKPPLKVAVDTSYEQDSDRAIRSVAKQLSECIGVKRRARKEQAVELDLIFAGWRGAVAAHAIEHFNAARWTECAMDDRDVLDVFEAYKATSGEARETGHKTETETETEKLQAREPQPETPPTTAPTRNLVYLSPDAKDLLETVDADTMYVIGGIVDLRARGTAWSLPKANALGIKTARLPIRENLPRATNQILNIDTVLKLLLEKYAGKDWPAALAAALPSRKQGERPARKNRPVDGETSVGE